MRTKRVCARRMCVRRLLLLWCVTFTLPTTVKGQTSADWTNPKVLHQVLTSGLSYNSPVTVTGGVDEDGGHKYRTGNYTRNCLTDCKVRRVRVTSAELANCLQDTPGKVSWSIGQQEVLDITLELDNSTGGLTIGNISLCLLDFSVPPGFRRSMLMMSQTCAEDVSLVMTAVNLVNSEPDLFQWPSCLHGIPPPGTAAPNMNGIYTNHSALALQVGSLSGRYEARVQVQAMVPRRALQMRFVSSSQGYVESNMVDVVNIIPPEDATFSSWDTNQALVLQDVWADDWVRIQIPSNSVAMISYPVVSLGLKYSFTRAKDWSLETDYYFSDHLLEVSEGSSAGGSSLLWRVDGPKYERPAPRLVRADHITVHYRNRPNVQTTPDKLGRELPSTRTESGDGVGLGFRMLFSFHQTDHAPEKLSSGRWNCSSDQWPEWSDHVTCNLLTECEGGQDESQCPYTLCGDQAVVFGSHCYSLHHSPGSLTWHMANAHCHERGGMLASFRAPGAFEFVTEELRLIWLARAGYFIMVGVRAAPDSKLFLYKQYLQYADQTIAYNFTFDGGYYKLGMALNYGVLRSMMSVLTLQDETFAVIERTCDLNSCYYLCETPLPSNQSRSAESGEAEDVSATAPLEEALPSNTSRMKVPHVICPQGFLVHSALANDADSFCFRRHDVITVVTCSEGACEENVTSSPMTFDCDNELEHVPYSVVCDHRADCQDGSDESFCVFPPCNITTHFRCNNGECLHWKYLSDKNPDCPEGEDLVDKYSSRTAGTQVYRGRVPPRLKPSHVVILRLSEYQDDPRESGPLEEGSTHCPTGHYRCANKGLCLPLHTRCNGMYDCPGKEDEDGCEDYTCVGFYHCRASAVCLELQQVCDGRAQCPQHDDEWMCQLTCPAQCQCLGWVFTCPRPFRVSGVDKLRVLDASDSGMRLSEFRDNALLVHLRLARCRLLKMDRVPLKNLRHLDLSDNSLDQVALSDLSVLTNLRVVILSGNPITSLFYRAQSVGRKRLPNLLSLDLSAIRLSHVDLSLFLPFPKLHRLNMSGCSVDVVSSTGNTSLNSLRSLDVRGNSLTNFPHDWLQAAGALRAVYADNFKVCCPALLPEGFPVDACRAPFDEVSSCDHLLRSNVYVACLAVFCVLALLGNAGSLLYRAVFSDKASAKSGFAVFVINLSLSDMLMGVYLLMIGVADRWFQNEYLWRDSSWRQSVACAVAGFLALTSCEVSALFIFLITLDRFLVLRFPFSRLRFRYRSAWLVCGACWLVGMVMAVVPLLPTAQHWGFYSQTSICVPLPVTITVVGAGRDYAFAVMVVLNFVLFILIAAGQASIFHVVRGHREMSNFADTDVNKVRRAQDKKLARRLLTVATSNFMCWFPIGLLGLMSSRGVAISGEVNVALVIFVLPLNAALNPFLYTFNMYQERLQQKKEARLLAYLKQLCREEGMASAPGCSSTEDMVTDITQDE